MGITTIDLIRHGEPKGGSRYRGQIDDPLSEKGWRQMRDAVQGHHPWDAIISSPLCRCADFANELAQRYNLPVELEARFMEIGFGEWEGKTRAEISDKDAGVLSRFYEDPVRYRPEGAEKLADFRDRIVSGLGDILNQHEGKHLLVVGHAGVIRMVMMYALNIPLSSMFRIQVPNAGITRLEVNTNGSDTAFRLICHAGSPLTARM